MKPGFRSCALSSSLTPPSSSPTATREFAIGSPSAQLPKETDIRNSLLQLAIEKGIVFSACAATFMQTYASLGFVKNLVVSYCHSLVPATRCLDDRAFVIVPYAPISCLRFLPCGPRYFDRITGSVTLNNLLSSLPRVGERDSNSSAESWPLPSSSGISKDWFRIRFIGEDRSGVVFSESWIFLFLRLRESSVLLISSLNALTRSSVAVVRLPARFDAEAVMSLSACREAPILPPLSSDDLGVKNRVKDRGVIVGALRGLLPSCFLGGGRTGDEVGFSPSIEAVALDRMFSWDAQGVSSPIL